MIFCSFRFLGANQLERIPYRAFFNLDPQIWGSRDQVMCVFFVKQSLSSKTDETDNSNDIGLHGKKNVI